MSKKESVLHESHFADMEEHVLKETLGYLWTRAKTLKDLAKTDPEVERMKGELKAYVDDNFNIEAKHLTKLLKAAKTIADLRGITWKAPRDEK